jgi:hypothetical protein
LSHILKLNLSINSSASWLISFCLGVQAKPENKEILGFKETAR